MKRVLALFGHNIKVMGGCEIYRVTMPLTELEKRSRGQWKASWMNTAYMSAILTMGNRDEIFGNDIVVLPRHAVVQNEKSKIAFEFFAALRASGSKLVYELDDDFTNRYRDLPGGGEEALSIARECDAITTTTKHLANLMQSYTGVKSYVTPNCLDMQAWNEDGGFVRSEKRLTIGLTGSSTHIYDWAVLETVIPKILEKYPNVFFILGGFQPHYFKKLDPDRHIHYPAVPYEHYRFLIRACDIILAPVDPEDGFNDSKSDIKAVEGMGSARTLHNGSQGGAAVIATNNSVYRHSVNHNVTGLLADFTAQSWYDNIVELIENESLRAKLSTNALRWVKKNRTIQDGYLHWQRAYTDILRRPSNDSISTNRPVLVRAPTG